MPKLDPHPPARESVFVYGTLRSGQCNHRFMTGSVYRGVDRTHEPFRMVDVGFFPGIQPGGDTRVVGEVYEVTPERLAALDQFEAEGILYQRAALRLASGRKAWGYVYCGGDINHMPAIASGDWSQRRTPHGR